MKNFKNTTISYKQTQEHAAHSNIRPKFKKKTSRWTAYVVTNKGDSTLWSKQQKSVHNQTPEH